jgi:hypothetical protein
MPSLFKVIHRMNPCKSVLVLKHIFYKSMLTSLLSLLPLGPAFSQDENEGPSGWKLVLSKNNVRGWESPAGTSALVQGIHPDRSDHDLDKLVLAYAKATRNRCPGFTDSVLIQKLGVNQRQVQSNVGDQVCTLVVGRGNALLVNLLAVDIGKGNSAGQSIVAARVTALTSEMAIQASTVGPFIAAFFETRTSTNGGTQLVTSVGADGVMMSTIIPSWTISASDNIHVLFADGTACWNCLDEYYADPRLTKLRREKPDELGKWRKIGNHYQLSYPSIKNESYKFAATDSLQTTNAGQLFHLKLATNTGVSSGSLVLRRDGSFSIASQADLDAIGSNRSDGKSDEYGTYQVNGPMIRFRFANGSLKQWSILVDPKNTQGLYIDRSFYYREKVK